MGQPSEMLTSGRDSIFEKELFRTSYTREQTQDYLLRNSYAALSLTADKQPAPASLAKTGANLPSAPSSSSAAGGKGYEIIEISDDDEELDEQLDEDVADDFVVQPRKKKQAIVMARAQSSSQSSQSQSQSSLSSSSSFSKRAAGTSPELHSQIFMVEDLMLPSETSSNNSRSYANMQQYQSHLMEVIESVHPAPVVCICSDVQTKDAMMHTIETLLGKNNICR